MLRRAFQKVAKRRLMVSGIRGTAGWSSISKVRELQGLKGKLRVLSESAGIQKSCSSAQPGPSSLIPFQPKTV